MGISGIFWIYKAILGPSLHILGGAGFGCRYQPTCSEYARTSFEQHSMLCALILTTKRIIRCNPWIRRDVWDPVPQTCACEHRRATVENITNKILKENTGA